jgi:hypothetical protein
MDFAVTERLLGHMRGALPGHDFQFLIDTERNAVSLRVETHQHTITTFKVPIEILSDFGPDWVFAHLEHLGWQARVKAGHGVFLVTRDRMEAL